MTDAIRSGFVDPDNWHYSMFEYAQMRQEAPPVTSARLPPVESDAAFLSRYHIRWD